MDIIPSVLEVTAQATVETGGRTLTREDLLNELKELTEEVSHLKTGYSRKGSGAKHDGYGQPGIEAPEGYAIYRDCRLHRLNDWAFGHSTQHGMSGTPTRHDWYFTTEAAENRPVSAITVEDGDTGENLFAPAGTLPAPNIWMISSRLP